MVLSAWFIRGCHLIALLYGGHCWDWKTNDGYAADDEEEIGWQIDSWQPGNADQCSLSMMSSYSYNVLSIRARHRNKEREEAVAALNDPDNPVQVLVTSI